jgi:hypothetical protein
VPADQRRRHAPLGRHTSGNSLPDATRFWSQNDAESRDAA